ncbi:MAG: tetratricopeptide repeat protein, partial [Planctomycetes bacterium]|nr:tetratricopeptide repeat protein [Planctomycetota bacterium]
MTEETLLNELNILRQNPGTSHEQRSAILSKLAHFYASRRQPNRSLPYLQELMTLNRELYGEFHENSVQPLSWLASTLVAIGRVDQAEQVLNDFASRCQAVKVSSIGAAAVALNHLVELYYHRGQFEAAKKICNRVITLFRERQANPRQKKEGKDRLSHSDLQWIRARNNEAALFVAMGQFNKARRSLARNIRNASLQLSPNDPALVVQLMNLASLQRMAGKLVTSERLTIRAIRQCQQGSGWYHPLIAQGFANLATYRLQSGRCESARSLLRKSLKIR